MTERDKKIAELQLKVSAKKTELSLKKEVGWKTNCSFPTADGTKNLNIQTASIAKIVDALASLLMWRAYVSEACKILNVEQNTTVYGYSYEEWISDLTERKNRITLAEERRKLNEMETKLASLMSEDAKAEKELSELEKLL